MTATSQRRAGLNPDQVLARTLAAIEEWEQAKAGSHEEMEASEMFTAMFATLSAHIENGGQLPAKWLAGLVSQDASTQELRDAYADLTLPGRVPPAAPIDWHRALRLAFTTIARLNAELDRYQGREVKLGLERYITSVLSDNAMPVGPEGSILRATDTGREWESKAGKWVDR